MPLGTLDGILIEPPSPILKLLLDTLLWVQNPIRHLSQLNALAIPLTKTPSGQELFAVGNFTRDIHRAPLPYRSCYLTPSYGLEVENPIHALK